MQDLELCKVASAQQFKQEEVQMYTRVKRMPLCSKVYCAVSYHERNFDAYHVSYWLSTPD